MPNIHGVHAPCAAGQENVREATGRCPGIQADKAGDGHLERIQGRRQLFAAAGRPGRSLVADQVRGRIQTLPGGQAAAFGTLNSNRPGQDERLGFGSGTCQATIDDQLIGSDAGSSRPGAGHRSGGCRGRGAALFGRLDPQCLADAGGDAGGVDALLAAQLVD